MPTSTACTDAPAMRAKALMVPRPRSAAANIAAVTFGATALTDSAAAMPQACSR